MATKRKKKFYSPPYPFFGLDECIEYIIKLHRAAGQVEVTKENAFKHMGLDPSENNTNRAYSAMTVFGLVNERRSGSSKMVSITGLGRIVLLAQEENSPRKISALQTAATNYEIIRKLRMRWPEGLPEDDSKILDALVLDEEFSQRSAKQFLPAFKKTYNYAKLGGYDILQESEQIEKNNQVESVSELENLFLTKTPTKPLGGFQEYKLTLSEKKEVRFLTSGNLTADDLDFVIQWLKRLDLINQRAIKPMIDEN